ncbi:hypothetical protein QFC22_002541 [Naganishia vaughanmartiniae]|uniref:Uncharacterized protein n=1 Tax=Naganishia vaughanmartiniae TaxID=1424756 RepID=A0ACC2XBD6_9TREE|nr:hypothetical protein QFC22_002541 [Naganishia vaughanmartiniae]
MPVVRKKGALFSVYHDSPPPTSSGSAAIASSSSATTGKPHSYTGKKDVLSGRSPTQRQKTKSSSSGSASGSGAALGHLKPSHAALVASAALQCHTGTTGGGARKSLGVLAAKTGNAAAAAPARGLRDPLSVKNNLGRDKENLRSLGMGSLHEGKPAMRKLQVFVDPAAAGAEETASGENKQSLSTTTTTRTAGPRRVFREKAPSEIRVSRPHLRQRSSSSLYALQHSDHSVSFPGDALVPSVVGQENNPPAGERLASFRPGKPSYRHTSHPSPSSSSTTIRNSTRMTTLTTAPPLTLVSPRRATRASTSASISASHDSAMEEDGVGDCDDEEEEEEEEEGSPFLVKPRLRKLKPHGTLSGSPNKQQRKIKMINGSSSTRANDMPSVLPGPSQTGFISSQTTAVQVVSSQPEAQEQEPPFSSPMIERPRTRKTTSISTSASTVPSSSYHPVKSQRSTKPSGPAAAMANPDPVLCDVSEAYGADPSVQPSGFQDQSPSPAIVAVSTSAGGRATQRVREERIGRHVQSGKTVGKRATSGLARSVLSTLIYIRQPQK